MGARVWQHIVPYQADVWTAVRRVQQLEFDKRRFHSAGGQFDSISDLLASIDESGTRSVLDVVMIGEEPAPGVMGRLSDEALEGYFGSRQPTPVAVKANPAFLDDLDRGSAVYIILYKNGEPNELLFAGVSYD